MTMPGEPIEVPPAGEFVTPREWLLERKVEELTREIHKLKMLNARHGDLASMREPGGWSPAEAIQVPDYQRMVTVNVAELRPTKHGFDCFLRWRPREGERQGLGYGYAISETMAMSASDGAAMMVHQHRKLLSQLGKLLMDRRARG